MGRDHDQESPPFERWPGYVIHKAPSPINGTRIVSIAVLNSSNRKTGNTVQIYHLCESINPVEAVNTGQDRAICGDCRHRKQPNGFRSCYVNLGQAPLSVWRAYHSGKYKTLWQYSELEHALQGRTIRWGAYGDPAVVPLKMVELLNSYAQDHLGYTHQWREPWAQQYKGLFMASVDSISEQLEARRQGWKTFLVMPLGTTQDALPPQTFLCANVQSPSITCLNCNLCDGASVNVWLPVHGPSAKRFNSSNLSTLSK